MVDFRFDVGMRYAKQRYYTAFLKKIKMFGEKFTRIS